ncbi:MAG TPA: hypothetical protein VE959_11275 [Bryobacteraceae bacterium]|nr:hypothetical protein [Bryobacteraceae bacterium]
MVPATVRPRSSPLSALLAGLQSGMLGVLAMLAWLGVSAKMQGRSFWTDANLMASTFYGDSAIHSGFAFRTLSGVALYVLLYSSLGALFALVVADRQPRVRVLLLSVLFAVGWYYVSYNLIWKSLAPLMVLLHSPQPAILGHLVYGTLMGQYPAHMPKPPAPAPMAEVAPVPGPERSVAETQSEAPEP